MKKTDLKDIKDLDILAIRQKVATAKHEMADLVLDKNMKKLKDTSVIRKKRLDIAQMLTVLRQKELLKQAEPKIDTKETKKGVKAKL